MAQVLDPNPTAGSEPRASLVLLLKIVALCAAAIVAGGTFTIWRGYPPQGLSPAAFVEVQQGVIRGLNVLLPAVGLTAIAATLALVWLSRGPARRWLLLAVLLLVAAGLVTRFGNQPINAIVIGWSLDALPEGWEAVRDRWWRLHLVRTALAGAGYIALALGCLVSATTHDPGR